MKSVNHRLVAILAIISIGLAAGAIYGYGTANCPNDPACAPTVFPCTVSNCSTYAQWAGTGLLCYTPVTGGQNSGCGTVTASNYACLYFYNCQATFVPPSQFTCATSSNPATPAAHNVHQMICW